MNSCWSHVITNECELLNMITLRLLALYKRLLLNSKQNILPIIERCIFHSKVKIQQLLDLELIGVLKMAPNSDRCRINIFTFTNGGTNTQFMAWKMNSPNDFVMFCFQWNFNFVFHITSKRVTHLYLKRIWIDTPPLYHASYMIKLQWL